MVRKTMNATRPERLSWIRSSVRQLARKKVMGLFQTESRHISEIAHPPAAIHFNKVAGWRNAPGMRVAEASADNKTADSHIL